MSLGTQIRDSTLFRMFHDINFHEKLFYEPTPENTVRRFYTCVGLAGVVRGLDYLIPRVQDPNVPAPPPSRTLELTTNLFDLPVWGILFIVFGMMLTFGNIRRVTMPAYVGHFFLCILYGMISIITAQGTIVLLDGFRSVPPLLVMTYLHWRGAKNCGFPRQSSDG